MVSWALFLLYAEAVFVLLNFMPLLLPWSVLRLGLLLWLFVVLFAVCCQVGSTSSANQFTRSSAVGVLEGLAAVVAGLNGFFQGSLRVLLRVILNL